MTNDDATTEDMNVRKVCLGARDLLIRRHDGPSSREDSILDPEELVERERPGSHGEARSEKHSCDGDIDGEYTSFDEAVLVLGFRTNGDELVVKLEFKQVLNKLALV